ncbi:MULTISPECIES: hypothetical protein [unclassified Moraxella]|uniref:hypothetical protein n=1 Tax=unclassified Moraxella TaxID=2685852 RepID=UPI003AF52BC0
MKNVVKGTILIGGALLTITAYSKNPVINNIIEGNKIAGFIYHNYDTPCQANAEEKHFDFCGKQAISKYNQAIKSGKPNYNGNLNLIRFDVKVNRKSGSYAETYLAVVNPKTREVYPFPYVISYDKYEKIAKTQFPKISYSQNSPNICGLEDLVNFYGDSETYKIWSGKECFAIQKEDNIFRFPTMPNSSFQ